jgi:hypothetical protein
MTISQREQKLDSSTIKFSQHFPRQKNCDMTSQRILLMGYFKSFQILQGLK